MLTNSHDYSRPTDETERAYLESLIRDDFLRCHPGESLDDVKRRAPFSRDDQGILREWMELAAARAEAVQSKPSFREKAESVK
ncbi:hypothetical protein [Rhodoblastus sp.]|jgi:hypothetical protein|uniref:hypothetical protein n=1 Tax=Rhodoblastus sp. TaxID=1962975 RepID=UPI0025D6A4F9|nr:hypothetical protein [Rhodoblastus sp.]